MKDVDEIIVLSKKFVIFHKIKLHAEEVVESNLIISGRVRIQVSYRSISMIQLCEAKILLIPRCIKRETFLPEQ
jgi:hypothetical protein